MKNRYLQHGDGPAFTARAPKRVVRRRSNRPQLLMLASGFLAIFFFFSALVVTFYLLPGAIEAELQRRVAVVQKHLGRGLE